MTITFLSILFSCSKLKRKGNEVVNSTHETASESKQRIIDKKNQIADNMFPTYDHDKPDTENNKKRFKEHLQVELSDDISEIYAYDDFVGIDYKVLLAFKCDTSTLSKIVKTKKMTLSLKNDDQGLIFSEEFPWWNKEEISKLKPYRVGIEYKYWNYLWYSSKSKVAYYLEFSI